jgi:hypothetical protein
MLKIKPATNTITTPNGRILFIAIPSFFRVCILL